LDELEVFQIKFSDLGKLVFAKSDFLEILELPPPSRVEFIGQGKPFKKALQVFLDLWHEIVIKAKPIPIAQYQYTCSCGSNNKLEGEALRARILMIIGSYYDCLVRDYLSSVERVKKFGLPPGMNLDTISSFIPRDHCETNQDLHSLGCLSFDYLLGVLAAFVSFQMKAMGDPSRIHEAMDRIFYQCALGLVNHTEKSRILSENIFAKTFLKGILEFQVLLAEDDDREESGFVQGPFSSIRLAELSSLAGRSDSAQKKYGAKAVERVFEIQLQLIWQSLGLMVVPARPGEKSIDLLCVTDNLNQNFSFLAEAKSTKSAYSLPAKDARAIREYVEGHQKVLSLLPPLAFVVIIGPSASKTLDGKVNELQSRTGVPIRFISAQLMAKLRSELRGTLPVEVFKNVLIQGPRIVDEEIINQVIQSYEEGSKGIKEFVEAMSASRGRSIYSSVGNGFGDCH